MHALSMETCAQVRSVIREAWQVHAYAVSPAISDIMLAAADGDTEKVRAGLSPLPANQVARWRQTALLTAVASNHPDTVRALIADGADPNTPSWVPPYTDRIYKGGVAAMSADPRFGGPEVIKGFQDSGLMQNKGQWFPHMLNQAVDCDEVEVIDALVEGGAVVQARLSSGVDALMIAVIDGNRGAIRSLLDHGADPCPDNRLLAHNAHLSHQKPHTLAGIARQQDIPANLVARLQCRAP